MNEFQVEGFAPTDHYSSQKIMLNDLSYYIKNMDRPFFHLVTNHAFDKQTDRQIDRHTDRRTDRILIDRVCIACSAVETKVTFSATEGHVSYVVNEKLDTDHLSHLCLKLAVEISFSASSLMFIWVTLIICGFVLSNIM